MNSVEYLIGPEEVSRSPLSAYSGEAIDFVSDLSGTIMKSPFIRAYPDIAALGFWCRRGNILKLRESCPESNLRLGRGLCFHIAPSNIPMSFAFSYLFGLFAGCSNIVRLPSKKFPQTEATVNLMREVLVRHPEIQKRTAFIRYPADNAITERFSSCADARMIWGGDKTIDNIRSLRTKPKCVDIAFADRYSFCVIDAKSVLKTDEARLNRLAEDFYNDTYLMDQNACSSPMVICWTNDCEEGRTRFWDAVYGTAEKRYALQAALCVDKYTKSCEDSIDKFDNIASVSHKTNLLYRVEIKGLVPGIEGYRGKGGYFYEYSMKSLEDMVPAITDKFQTITWFGLDPEEIRKVVIRSKLRGIDRITPIGKAMDIGVIWDGYDLVRMLSRYVNVE